MVKTTISMTIDLDDLRMLDKLKGIQGRGQFIMFCVKKHARSFDSTDSVDAEKIVKLASRIEEISADRQHWMDLALYYKEESARNATKTTELDRE